MEELLKILSPLDWSRQATWNLGRGVSDLTEGKMPALADILPGLLGAGAGLGLAATGVGIPAALLGGSIFGALNQGAYGNQAANPSDVAGSDIGGVLLSALTDPMTFGLTGAGIQGAKRLLRGRPATAPAGASVGSALPVESMPQPRITESLIGEAPPPNLLADRLTSDPGIVERTMLEMGGDKPTIEQLASMVNQTNPAADDLVRNLEANYAPLGGLGGLRPAPQAVDAGQDLISRMQALIGQHRQMFGQ